MTVTMLMDESSIGRLCVGVFVCVCALQYLQTDESDLIDWAMRVNDKLENKQDDDQFDAAAALQQCALAYFKEKKVCVEGISLCVCVAW